MKKKIIIGASKYGSKVDLYKSLKIINFLYKNGFKYFDTAPLYGCGLSHYIFNKTKKKILITTKIGQPLKLSLLEILKRIYRFNGFDNFIFSFKHFCFNERSKKKFWSKKNLKKIINEYQKELNNNIINAIYLHKPPYKLITKKNLLDFISLSKEKKFKPGICNLSVNNLNIINNKNLILQMDIKFFFENHEKLKKIENPIEIFGLFSYLKSISLFKKKEFKVKFTDLILKNKKVKIIIPINNIKRAAKFINDTNKKTYFNKILN